MAVKSGLRVGLNEECAKYAKVLTVLTGVIWLSGVSMPLAWADDGTVIDGRLLAQSCYSCHLGGGAIPNLKNRSASQILEQMKQFRSDNVAGHVMPRLARGFDDQELEALAKAIEADRSK